MGLHRQLRLDSLKNEHENAVRLVFEKCCGGAQPRRRLMQRRWMSLHSLAPFLMAFLILCVVGKASAKDGYPPCTEEPSESDVDAAKGAFQAGRISFEEGDYDRAILYWEDAFRRDCTAVKLLLNVARAYELKGSLSPAVIALETYLERDNEVAEPGTVEKRIEKLKARVAEQEEQQRRSEPAPPPSPKKEKVQPRDAPASTKTHRPLWPVVTTATGVAGLAVGVTFAALGQSAVGNEKDRIAKDTVATDSNGNTVRCSRDGRNWDCPSEELKEQVELALKDSDDLKRAKTERTVGILVASGGAVIAGVGAYFWYTLWSKGTKDSSSASRDTLRPTLLPVIEPGYQGLSLSGQF